MATKPVKKARDATRSATKRAGQAKDTAKKTAGGDLLGEAVQGLAGTIVRRAATSASKWVNEATDRLTDYASGDGDGGLLGAITGSAPGSIKGSAATGALKSGLAAAAGKVKDSIKNAFGGGGSGRGPKLTNIVEHIDIGVDIGLAYDLWTRFTDFPDFMKKVENVEQTSDEKLTWKAQIFWSHRTWESTIVEQVPEKRIVWRSKGEKGSVDGAVTFHELAPDLTRIVLVLEYRPQGLFERTGNLWRAQGRRARLELKHFQRQAMVHELLRPDEVEGWRGEIHDGQAEEAEDRPKKTKKRGGSE
jgi:uncharacterized membrane protein